MVHDEKMTSATKTDGASCRQQRTHRVWRLVKSEMTPSAGLDARWQVAPAGGGWNGAAANRPPQIAPTRAVPPPCYPSRKEPHSGVDQKSWGWVSSACWRRSQRALWRPPVCLSAGNDMAMGREDQSNPMPSRDPALVTQGDEKSPIGGQDARTRPGTRTARPAALAK